MSETNIVEFRNPSDISPDLLTETVRKGARRLLATAVSAEVESIS